MNRPLSLLLEKGRTPVTVEYPPLFQGGEGGIHAIPGTSLLAKIYHQPSASRAAKLAAMLCHPPARLRPGNGTSLIVWPQDRLLQVRAGPACVGYVMEQVRDKGLLSNYYHPNLRSSDVDFRFLVRLARNLAATVQALHARNIVVGDVNPSNILAGVDASVALIDTDSFQITTPRAVFRSVVGTPEYTPPELRGVLFGEVDRKPEHDAFGLAVLIFLLLMNGNHPFGARYTGTANRLTLEQRIARGFWPYARDPTIPYRPRRGAPPFDELPPPVQALLRQCFEVGHRKPRARPTAAAWEQALADTERLPNLNWPGGHPRVRQVSRVLRKQRWAEQFRLLWNGFRGQRLKLSWMMTPFRVFLGWTKTRQEQRWCFWSRLVGLLIVLIYFLLGGAGPFSGLNSPAPNDPQQSEGAETPSQWQDLRKNRPTKD